MIRDVRPLRAGRLLAPGYKVLGCLSRGRVCDIYDVWSNERDCRCIAKVVRAHSVKDGKAQRMLLREGRLLQSLSHPHIVRSYEMLREPFPILILETLTGATLSHIIANRHRLGLHDLVFLGIHLCSAMHYLHRHTGFLHTDLKPSNIVSERGYTKVIDLSIARRPGRARRGVGTRQYLAPEQARGDRLSAATDVWGIGVVLFDGATGRRVFHAKSGPVYEQLQRRAESVRTYRRLPPLFGAAVDGCLEPNPRDRPTITELSKILNGLI